MRQRIHRPAFGALAAGAAALSMLIGACDRTPAPTPSPSPTPTPTPAPAPNPVSEPASVAQTPPEPPKPPHFGPEPVVDGPVAEALNEFFKRAVAHGFSGCVLVAVDDKVILHNAYGLADRDNDVPINLRTRFDVGSIAKQFTATAALRLVMQGKLQLDEPIVRWFDVETLGLIPARNRTITLKHLLSHTSGIPRMFDVDGVDMKDRDAVVAKLLSREFQRPPGRTHMYSNANYFILAAVIERASGMPFEQAMHELVFTPAGLKDTMLCGEPDPPETVAAAASTGGEAAPGDSAAPTAPEGATPASATSPPTGEGTPAPPSPTPTEPGAAPPVRLSDMIATGHEENTPDDEVDVRMDMGNGWYPHGATGPAHKMPFAWGHRGATGVITTAADLLAWHRAMANDDILPADLRKLIITPAIRTYAMGWEVGPMDNGMYMVGHSGSMIGFEADFRRYFANVEAAEKGQGAKVVTIVTSNSRGGRMNALRQVLERALLKGSDGSAPALPQPPAAPATADKAVDPAVLDACLGIYVLPTGGELMVAPGDEAGTLKVFAFGQDAANVVHPPTAHAAPIFSYTSRRAERVLRAWHTGEEIDVREQRRSVDPSVSDTTLAEWTARWKASGSSPLKAIRPLGSFTKDSQLQTIVLFDYAGATEVARVLWKEDLITSIEPTEELPIFSQVAAECGWPKAAFASSGEQWWVTLRLEFERSGDAGPATSLTVKGLGQEVRAERGK